MSSAMPPVNYRPIELERLLVRGRWRPDGLGRLGLRGRCGRRRLWRKGCAWEVGDMEAELRDASDCAGVASCLVLEGEAETHRVYGTVSWDSPGKLQVELYFDRRESFTANKSGEFRASRLEVRSYVTWRPIYPSPVTLRFDLLQVRWRHSELAELLRCSQ